MPFAIVGLAIAHIALLHKDGSNNPIGIDSSVDKIPFFPYFYFKDLFSIFVFILIFSFFLFFYPNQLGHSDNYIPANSMVTPSHIVPE
jgi:quinol-cytochrome oxidoreductase complex cytochrome b subunit